MLTLCRRAPATNPNLISLRDLTYLGSGAGDGNGTHTGGASEPLKHAVLRDEGVCGAARVVVLR
jgi:hypothetical protein